MSRIDTVTEFADVITLATKSLWNHQRRPYEAVSGPGKRTDAWA